MASPVDLLTETEQRALRFLANAHGPASGRSVGEQLDISPTTASRTLSRLEKLGFVTHEEFGRTFNWRLNFQDPTVEAWLLGTDMPSTSGSNPRPKMTAVIFTALFEEFEAVADFVALKDSKIVPPTRFMVGDFAGKHIDWSVHVAEIGIGNITTATAVTAASANLRPRPDLVVFVGVAGSVKPKDACQGDVVIPDRVNLLGPGKEVLDDDEGSLFLGRAEAVPTHNGVLQLARQVAHLNWMARLGDVRPDLDLKNARGARPRALVKPIAAGQRVHADVTSESVAYLRAHMNDVVAIDMESGGLYGAAFATAIPALAVRGISDQLADKDPEQDEEWQPRAASHAASFTFTLLDEADPRDIVPWGSTDAPPNPPQAEPPSSTSMLPLLPPGVSLGFAWATRRQTNGANRFLALLYEHREQSAKWLAQLDPRRPPAAWEGDDRASLWFMAAEFAGAHDHESATKLYEAAALHAEDDGVAATLLARAAMSATAFEQRDEAVRLIAEARRLSPLAENLWGLVDPAMSPGKGDDAVGRAAVVAAALGLPVGPLAQRRVLPDTGCVELASRLRVIAPELLDELRFVTAQMLGNALRMEGQLERAQYLHESLINGKFAPDTPSPVWGLLVGPRSAACLVDLAQTLIARALSMTETGGGVDVQSTLLHASELAMTARSRRQAWHGPTGKALVIAADAIARSGDPRRALTLLLPPPRGSAAADEAASPEVVDAAPAIAYLIGDVDLTLELAKRLPDPRERRLIDGVALMGRGDSRHEAEAAFRDVLNSNDVAKRPDQMVRALMGLAGVGGFTEADERYLADVDPEIRDLIRAQSALATGRGADAQTLMWKYADSEPAALFTAEHLRNKGEAAEAVKVLEAYATNRGDDHILFQAALMARSENLLDVADGLARRVVSSKNPALRRAARELIVDLAQQGLDWNRVVSETSALLADVDTGLPEEERRRAAYRYRWARVNAFAQKRMVSEAYTELYRDPPLEIDKPELAQLALAVLRAVATEVHVGGDKTVVGGNVVSSLDVLRKASEIAQQFRDREEIVGAALITSLSMPQTEGDINTEELIVARQLQDQFREAFPESTIAETVSLPEDPNEMLKIIAEQQSASASQLDKMQREVYVGRAPLSVLSAAAHRGYAQALIQNGAGCYIIASPVESVIEQEIASARGALGGRVVIDTSALFFAELVLGDFGGFRSRFSSLVLPSPLRDDVLQARATLSNKAVGAVGWDPVTQSPRLALYNDDLTDSWLKEANRLQELLKYCEVRADALFDGDQRARTWSSSIRLAKELGVPLVADDAALRRVAAAEGVASFGTLQLLQSLEQEHLVAAGSVERAFEQLQPLKAAELPLLPRLLEIAAKESWRPGGYASFLLTRPTTWSRPIKNGLGAYMELVKRIPNRTAEIVASWCSFAAFGLFLTVPPALGPISVGSLIAWTVLETRDPDVLRDSMNATRHLVKEFAPDGNVLREILRVLTENLLPLVGRENLAPLMTRLLSALDDEERYEAMRLFLSIPWPEGNEGSRIG